MSGGIIQLVAFGVQDMYLTSNPSITFFKIVYRRHTNFSIESVIQNFSASSHPNFNEKVSCTISKNGDLINKILMYVEIPSIHPFYINDTSMIDTKKKFAWVKYLGYALIKEISIEIGGKNIDKQYGEWLYLWSQLSDDKQPGLNKMVGNTASVTNLQNEKPGFQLFIPLNFWFCKHIGLSLPLVALSSSDVRLIVVFRKFEECCCIGPTHSILMDNNDVITFKPGDYIYQTINHQTIYGLVTDYDYLTRKLYYIKIMNPTSGKRFFESPSLHTHDVIQDDTRDDIQKLKNYYKIINSLNGVGHIAEYNTTENVEDNTTWFISKPKLNKVFFYVNYIYLDNEERIKFVTMSHEYLIEQLQMNQISNVDSPVIKFKLSVNHPGKEFIWVAQLDRMNPSSVFTHQSRYMSPGIITSAKLVTNGIDRVDKFPSLYFNSIQPLTHHTRTPEPGIGMYSFATQPEKNQPSSTLNMSKIDDAFFMFDLHPSISPTNTAKIRVYYINYNILRIMCQMGGIAFDT